MNLSLCNNSNIKVFYVINNSTKIDISLANSMKKSGVDIFNINDDFFNDICRPYSSISGNDIILEDRIKDIYQNYYLCEEGCNYNEIFLENMTISCECKVKNNITTKVSDINLDVIRGISTSNYDIIKCYNLVFSLNGKINNYGFWIFTFLLLGHIPLLIFYFRRGIEPVKDYLFKEMTEYGYLKKSNEGKYKDGKGKDILINNPQIQNPPPKEKKDKAKHVLILSQDKTIKNKHKNMIDNSSSIKRMKTSERDVIDQINNEKLNRAKTYKKKKLLIKKEQIKKLKQI